MEAVLGELAMADAKAAGADDIQLRVERDIRKAATEAREVFVEATIITRGLSTDILHGITRASLLKYAKEAQMEIEERNFTPDEARDADEAFISSASTFVMPVVKVDGAVIGDGKPGAVSKRLREIYIDESRKRAI